jgi:hypothetical protein
MLIGAFSRSWFADGTDPIGLREAPHGASFEPYLASIAFWSALVAAGLVAATAVVATVREVAILRITAAAWVVITLVTTVGFVWGAPRGLAIGFAYPTFLVSCITGLIACHLASLPLDLSSEVGQYLDGVRHDRWLVYDARGRLRRVDTYDRGRLTSSSEIAGGQPSTRGSHAVPDPFPQPDQGTQADEHSDHA